MAKRKRQSKPKKIIAYSFFETTESHPLDLELYRAGLVINAINCQRYFPGWEMHVYYDHTINKNTYQKLVPNVIWNYVRTTQTHDTKLLMSAARFLAANDPNAEIVIFRDVDNELSTIDYRVMEMWLRDDTTCFHRYGIANYFRPLVASCIAIKPRLFRKHFGGNLMSKAVFEKFAMEHSHDYGCDEIYLKEQIYPQLLKLSQLKTTVVKEKDIVSLDICSDTVCELIENFKARIEYVLVYNNIANN